MNAEKLLERVTETATWLARAGEPYDGLIPSLLDRSTGAMLETMPSAIAGQRDGDRAHLGANLMHDHALLATFSALGRAQRRTDLAEAADRYLQRWTRECTDTPTGLFPWGEHAYWHLRDNAVGNSYLLRTNRPPFERVLHDHLIQAPVWLWDKLHELDPDCVAHFCEGLDYHWKEGEPAEYSRHATLNQMVRPARTPRSCDFPRHSGFYILDWGVGYLHTGVPRFADDLRRTLDYWWNRRDARGLLLSESRTPESDHELFNRNAAGQTLSLGASLLDTAYVLDGMIEAGDLPHLLRERAAVYTEGFLSAPHDPAAAVFVDFCDRTTHAIRHVMPIWGSRYAEWPAARVALIALSVYRSTLDERLLQWASAAGRAYLATAFPSDVAVPAEDAGLAVELLADLYDLTGDKHWRDDGLVLAGRLMDVYVGGAATAIPRGAAGIDWYESQLGTAHLVHGMARLALLAVDATHCPLAANYAVR